MKNSKVFLVVASTLAITISSGVTSSGAETPTAPVERTKLSAEQKAAFWESIAQFRSARDARQAAVASARASIATARANFEAARASATTPEARKAARQAFKSAVNAARATIPSKPVRPVRP